MKTSLSDAEMLAWIVKVDSQDFPETPFDLRQAEQVVDVQLWLSRLKLEDETISKDVCHMRNVVIDRLRKAYEICSLENIRRLQEMLF